MFKVLKDFKGSPDGIQVIQFEAGQEVDLVPDLAKVALEEKWVKAMPVKKVKSAEEVAAEAEAFAAKCLLGSSQLPSLIRLENGMEMQLGELVNAAFAASGLTAVAWNKLPEADREQLLADQFTALNAPA